MVPGCCGARVWFVRRMWSLDYASPVTARCRIDEPGSPALKQTSDLDCTMGATVRSPMQRIARVCSWRVCHTLQVMNPSGDGHEGAALTPGRRHSARRHPPCAESPLAAPPAAPCLLAPSTARIKQECIQQQAIALQPRPFPYACKSWQKAQSTSHYPQSSHQFHGDPARVARRRYRHAQLKIESTL